MESSSVCTHLQAAVHVPAYSLAVDGTSSQTHCLNPAAGVGMPALGMSGLWALGLGFPRPPCQRISSSSDHRERRTIPPLFSDATGAAHIPLYIFHGWWNSTKYAAAVLPHSLFPRLPLSPSLFTLFTSSTAAFSLFLHQFLLFSSTVCWWAWTLFFSPLFFLRKEEGLC